jgi:hypothetical protein
MIYDIWYMIYDIWYMINDVIYDIWYMIYDIWYIISYIYIWYMINLCDMYHSKYPSNGTMHLVTCSCDKRTAGGSHSAVPQRVSPGRWRSHPWRVAALFRLPRPDGCSLAPRDYPGRHGMSRENKYCISHYRRMIDSIIIHWGFFF